MGLGIWAMHYIGMLAFSMPIPVLYDLPTVGLSLLAAIIASGIALHILSRPELRWPQQVLGSLTMGSGIAAMHYIGMAAMRMPARIHYNPGSGGGFACSRGHHFSGCADSRFPRAR